MLIDGIVASGVSGLTIPVLETGDIIVTDTATPVITQSGYNIRYSLVTWPPEVTNGELMTEYTDTATAGWVVDSGVTSTDVVANGTYLEGYWVVTRSSGGGISQQFDINSATLPTGLGNLVEAWLVVDVTRDSGRGGASNYDLAWQVERGAGILVQVLESLPGSGITPPNGTTRYAYNWTGSVTPVSGWYVTIRTSLNNQITGTDIVYMGLRFE